MKVVRTPNIEELQRSQAVLKNLEKVVKSSTFPGSEALSVADGILLIRSLIKNCDDSLKAEIDKQKQSIPVEGEEATTTPIEEPKGE